jgi:hypothetical protein
MKVRLPHPEACLALIGQSLCQACHACSPAKAGLFGYAYESCRSLIELTNPDCDGLISDTMHLIDSVYLFWSGA